MTMGALELRINLGSLKRQDPYIDSIIDSSTHVAIYSFSPQQNEWEKTEVEGTLFVYRRVAPPYWGFTIMNRLSMENLTEPLAAELEFQTQNPFLLYRNAKLLIYGIWFYDQEDCKRIGELLQRLCKDANKPSVELRNLQPAKLFAGGDADFNLKGSTLKSPSPASNSANSISPGSSVGGPLQQGSTGEADSECDDKEITQSKQNGGVDILDLLSKAQDKFEKEKRNTPDLPIHTVNCSSMTQPTVTDTFIIKPVPVKPTNHQKLDVATLFKQHPSGPVDSFALNQKRTNGGVGSLHASRLTNPYHGTLMQPVPAVSSGPTSTIHPRNANARQLGRSHSMTEVAMAKHMDMRMSGNVLSVEEVEKGLGKNVVVASAKQREQQVNSALDKMIDRINSGQALSTADHPQASTLPVLSEVTLPTTLNTSDAPGMGHGGSMFVIGNQPIYSEADVFSGNNTAVGQILRPLQHSMLKGKPQVQRSMSSSALPSSNTFPAASGNIQFKNCFPLPQLSTTATVLREKDGAEYNADNSSALLHGNGAIGNTVDFSANDIKPTPSAVATTIASRASQSKVSKTHIISEVNKCSTPTTLISPENFERSATTPQKTLELKQRLLEAPNTCSSGPSSISVPDPLTKSQLRNALITLLQKDDKFLSAIHDTYLASLEQL